MLQGNGSPHSCGPLQSFTAPHDIACSSDMEQVYVGEIGPNRLWRFVQEVHKSGKKVLEDVPTTPATASSSSGSSTGSKVPGEGEEEENFGFSMVVVALLAVPILSFLVITLIVRLRRKRDKGKGWSQQGSKLDLGQLLQPHRGFDRLALDDTASEGSESDVEEYHAPAARKA